MDSLVFDVSGVSNTSDQFVTVHINTPGNSSSYFYCNFAICLRFQRHKWFYQCGYSPSQIGHWHLDTAENLLSVLFTHFTTLRICQHFTRDSQESLMSHSLHFWKISKRGNLSKRQKCTWSIMWKNLSVKNLVKCPSKWIVFDLVRLNILTMFIVQNVSNQFFKVLNHTGFLFAF